MAPNIPRAAEIAQMLRLTIKALNTKNNLKELLNLLQIHDVKSGSKNAISIMQSHIDDIVAASPEQQNSLLPLFLDII